MLSARIPSIRLVSATLSASRFTDPNSSSSLPNPTPSSSLPNSSRFIDPNSSTSSDWTTALASGSPLAPRATPPSANEKPATTIPEPIPTIHPLVLMVQLVGFGDAARVFESSGSVHGDAKSLALSIFSVRVDVQDGSFSVQDRSRDCPEHNLRFYAPSDDESYTPCRDVFSFGDAYIGNFLGRRVFLGFMV
ncbi:hypothetical protein C8J56DRAFT_1052713 [Mycena floridula]|nr:hypothetical protein C8J56DRAFT_1052713 [Mycena floridula]